MPILKNTGKEYHGSEGISKSSLFRMSVSPEYFKWCMDNPQEKTDSLIFGSAFHKAVLEPHDFDSEFAIYPDCDRRTKEGKVAYSAFLTESDGKDVISSEEWAQKEGAPVLALKA